MNVKLAAKCARVALLAMALAVFPGEGPAHAYPDRPVRLIVPYPPGGASDILARALAEGLTESLGQQVVVENRAGAGGTIGTTAAAQAHPDGYTILLGHAGPIAVNPSLYSNLQYDPLKDFVPITKVAEQQNVVVVDPSLSSVKSIQDLIDLAKAKPGALNMASGGTGTGSHLAGELFKSATGTDMLHIPYKGNAPAVVALLGGEAQVMFPSLITVKGHIQAGRLRALAATTAARMPAMPDLPTVAETVRGFEASVWYGVLAPAGTPRSVVGALHSALVKILARPVLQARFAERGLALVADTPEKFATFIKAEQAKWAKVIKEAGIRKE